MANLIGCTVAFTTENSMGTIEGYDLQNIVLGPFEMYNMTCTFAPLEETGDDIVLTFAVISTESIVYDYVEATFKQLIPGPPL